MVVMGVAYGTDECRLIWLKTIREEGQRTYASGISSAFSSYSRQESLRLKRIVASRGACRSKRKSSAANIARTVVEIARSYQVTQIFVPHLRVDFLQRLRGKNFTEDIVRLAQDLQVTVVAGRSRRPATP